MLTKRDVVRIIEQMPEASTLSDILAELAVLRRIEQGLADLDAGRVVDHGTAKLRLARWIGSDE